MYRYTRLLTTLTIHIPGDAYESEINEKNPIGNRGDLARAYGDLMKQLWCGNSSTVAPRHFKVMLCTANFKCRGLKFRKLGRN